MQVFQVVFLFDFGQEGQEVSVLFGVNGQFPFLEYRGRGKSVRLSRQSVYALKALPVSDHDQGQNTEEDVRAREKRHKSSHGKKNGFTDEEERVFGSLLFDKEE